MEYLEVKKAIKERETNQGIDLTREQKDGSQRSSGQWLGERDKGMKNTVIMWSTEQGT